MSDKDALEFDDVLVADDLPGNEAVMDEEKTEQEIAMGFTELFMQLNEAIQLQSAQINELQQAMNVKEAEVANLVREIDQLRTLTVALYKFAGDQKRYTAFADRAAFHYKNIVRKSRIDAAVDKVIFAENARRAKEGLELLTGDEIGELAQKTVAETTAEIEAELEVIRKESLKEIASRPKQIKKKRPKKRKK